MKLHHVVIALGVIVLGAGFWFLFFDDSSARRTGESVQVQGQGKGNASVNPTSKIKNVKKPAAAAGQKMASAVPLKADAADDTFTPAEQKVVDDIQEALDDEKLERVLSHLQEASASKNPNVRMKMVEALQWFGEKALPELTPFLADTDDDVKSQAETAVEQGLSQMDDDRAKVQYIESIMSVKGACSMDSLNMLSGQLNGISDETLTVSAALRIIEANKNPEAVQAMKEVYEFATGDAYTTADAARTWLKNKQVEAASAVAEE